MPKPNLKDDAENFLVSSHADSFQDEITDGLDSDEDMLVTAFGVARPIRLGPKPKKVKPARGLQTDPAP